MADADRQGWSAGRDHVGLRRGPGPCVCRQFRPACFFATAALGVSIPMQAAACLRWTLPAGKSRCRCRRSRVVAAANAALRSPQRSPQFPVLFSRAQ